MVHLQQYDRLHHEILSREHLDQGLLYRSVVNVLLQIMTPLDLRQKAKGPERKPSHSAKGRGKPQ